MAPGSLRASDLDRARVADVLHQAASDGYLSLDEFEERVGAAYQARYIGELDGLLADIPGGLRPGAPLAEPGPRWHPAPHRALRTAVAVVIAMLAISAVVHLWLPMLIIGLILCRRGWRPGRHYRGYGPRYGLGSARASKLV